MRIDIPGRGTADINSVAIVAPVGTDTWLYRAARKELDFAAAAWHGKVKFAPYRWSEPAGTDHMLRQMVHDLVAERSDGRPIVDALCMLGRWRTDAPAAFAAAVAGTCGATVMDLDEWLRTLGPARMPVASPASADAAQAVTAGLMARPEPEPVIPPVELKVGISPADVAAAVRRDMQRTIAARVLKGAVD